MNTEQIHGTLVLKQAESLLWASKYMQGLLDGYLDNSDHYMVQIMGCFCSVSILRPFTAELALKGLYQKLTGNEAEHTHNLHELFCLLPATTQNAIETQFQAVKKQYPGYKGRDTVEQLLLVHKNDFINLRYCFFQEAPKSPKEQGSIEDTKISNLQLAIEAIMKVAL
ncbi:MAG: hypothetical protein OXH16_01350 [Gemmatimonadetes bacterium]|nr:hypothetical protein [Gemmatimonadota bacterium]